MGGWGSGRQHGRPTADEAKRIDFAWMLRKGYAAPGKLTTGRLCWTCRDRPAGEISYTCDMTDPESGRLRLDFTVTDHREGTKQDHTQNVLLSYTVPHFGGKRWWMHCPVNHERVGKLYCPAGGDIFASRTAWRLGYHSQRIADRDKPFEALFRLQKKLGCPQGWEAGLRRPKGMHHKTFERHWQRYWELDAICGATMASVVLALRERIG